jgi:hypothetical protein
MSQGALLYYTVPGHKSDNFSGDALRGIATAHHPRRMNPLLTHLERSDHQLSATLHFTGAEVSSYEYVHTNVDKLYVEVFMRVVGLTRRRRKFSIGPCGWTTEAADEGLACHLLRELHGVLVLN